jgi:hypothetical protein
MTILDRARGKRKRRIRLDVGQLADELAKLAPDMERMDLSKARGLAAGAIQDASDRARQSLDRASERARELRADLANAPESGRPEHALEELGQRLRDLAGPGGLRTLLARVERELPDTDKDRYDRAYARGRIQARTVYLALGLAAGVSAGIAAALLLEPRHGRERREALVRRVRGLTSRASSQVGDAGERIRDRVARGPASIGVMDVPETPLPAASGPIPDAGVDPEAEPHEALPEPPSPAGEPPAEGDPTDPTIHA